MEAYEEDLAGAFSRLQQSLRSYLRRRIADPALADDLLQDVFVKALTTRRSGRRIENLTGWLFAAARTTLVDHFRSVGPLTEEVDEALPDTATDDDLRLHQELASCLRTFIARLPPIYRDTLIATDLEGETMRSFATRHALSPSAIKSRASRGRTMLRDLLLACCRVEMTGGLVSDYHRHSKSCCNGSCASSSSRQPASNGH